MKLCLYCGTFNPIHNAHIAVANYVKSNFDFDLILFIPSYIPPHKNIDKILANHRFNMVKLALEDYSSFKVSDIEFKSEQNSYTYNTIKKLYELYNDIDNKINFIIGTDAFRNIEHWYRAEELKNLVEFIVFVRENDFKSEDFEILREKGYNFKFTKMPFVNISSTNIRNYIKNDQSISNLLPEKVENYIIRNGLYKNENN